MDDIRDFVKAKVLCLLSKLVERSSSSRATWVSLPDIARLAAVKASSLRVLMPRWVGWQYVKSWAVPAVLMSDGRAHTLYTLDFRGEGWITRMDRWYPRAREVRDFIDNLANCTDVETDLVLIDSRRLQLNGLAWPVPGTNGGCCMLWPFAAELDVYPVVGWGTNIRCRNINEAYALAQSLYKKTPTQECVQSAVATEKYILRSAQDVVKRT